MTDRRETSSSPATPPHFRAGMASIVGRPNVGKSTLLNAILGQKVAIVSPVPQTTRMPVRGVYTDDERQIVFIDTPGLHPTRDRLGEWMNTAAATHFQGVDAVVHLVDVSEPVGDEEQRLVDRLKALPPPVVLGLNKVDVTDRFIPDYIEAWKAAAPERFGDERSFVLLPLSGARRINVEKLIEILSGFMPESPPLYPMDTICDVPVRQAVADIIREKCLLALREEVPHSLGVVIESMRPGKNNVTYIRACLVLERESQKAIVIGKGGRFLKRIGTLAREELEFLLKSRVYLELFVKSQKDWRQDMRVLMEMGFQPLEEKS